MCSDEIAMLAACAANPDDEAGSLVHADWLQEHSEGVYKTCTAKGPHHGDTCDNGRVQSPNSQFTRKCAVCKGSGLVPDTIRADRAELIRLQIELARYGPTGENCPGCGLRWKSRSGVGQSMWCENQHRWEGQDVHQLRERESAIIAANPDWLPRCAACGGDGEDREPDMRGDKCPTCNGTGKAPCTWRAGYVSCVSVPTIASVLEEVTRGCKSCRGWGTVDRDGKPIRMESDAHHDCPACDGITRVEVLEPTEYARYLHDNFYPTLTGVMPVNRVPDPIQHDEVMQVCWYMGGARGTRSRIPELVFSKLTGGYLETEGDEEKWMVFPTAELANTALSRALRAMIWGEKIEERIKQSPQTTA
jgi:uncharacterized protein (TIGR02996 family)